MAIDLSINGGLKEKLAYAFKIYDTDKDGKLSKGEVTRIIKNIYDFHGEENLSSEVALKNAVEIFAKLGFIIIYQTQ